MTTNTALPSWNDGATKAAILDFVARVTNDGAKTFVPPEARIAVFDNDGTLWCEKPLPIQADFLLDKIGEQAAKDASLRGKQPWKAVWEKDYKWLSDTITKYYRGDDTDLKVMMGGCWPPTRGRTSTPLPRRRTYSCAAGRTWRSSAPT